VRTDTEAGVSSTRISIASPNLLPSASSEESTTIFAVIRASDSLCVLIRTAPWLWSISKRCPRFIATVLSNFLS
jgi:hypothetical protein